MENTEVTHIKKNNIEYLQFNKLLKYKEKVQHCFTLKNLDFKRDENLQENYKKIMTALEIEDFKIVRPIQEHTDNIKIIKTGDEDLSKTDACITAEPKILLSLIFADCTPILLYDYEKNIIAAIHSGWKGTAKRIAYKTVQKMITELQSDPQNIIAVIGPTIKDCHFEVQNDVKEIFETEFPEMEDCILNRENKTFIDLVKINKKLLIKAGIHEKNISDSNICTVCNSRKIHSRRCSKVGINTLLIALL